MIINPYLFGATFVGPLDSYTANLWAAYAIKRLLTSYTGALLRVRRSSDNAEQDIGYLASGALDTPALASFVGANSGLIRTWYDQSGNTRNAAQATTSAQPRIVNAGVYDGFLVASGAQELLTAATSGTGTVLSTASKVNMRSNAATQVVFACGPGGAGHTIAQSYIPSAASQLDVYVANSGGTAQDNGFTSTYPTGTGVYGTVHLMGAGSGAAAALLFIGGSAQTRISLGSTPPTGNFTAETWRLMSGGGANFALTDTSSFCVWEADQTSNMAGINTALA